MSVTKERKVNEAPIAADLDTLRDYGHVLNKIIDGWPVILTADIPAGTPSLDGLVILEAAGGSNRNIVFFAGGNRYRVTGSLF